MNRKNEPSDVFHGFTQPAQLDNLLVSTQGITQGTTQGSQAAFQRLVKRMTRFWVKLDKEKTEAELKDRFDKKDGYTCAMTTPGILTIKCLDRRGMQLVFKATMIELEKQVLLDFRLSRGDGIEFKRRFTEIKQSMEHLVAKHPIMWSLAIHANDLPGV